LKIGTKLLIEHGAYHDPIATIEITGNSGGAGALDAEIRQVHGSTHSVQVGARTIAYKLPFNSKISREFGSDTWRLKSATGDTAIEEIEQAMADSKPVMVHTRLTSSGRGQHWVISEGMKPILTAAPGGHRGTYRVADPAREIEELLDRPLRNKLCKGRIGEPIGAPPREGLALLALAVTGEAVVQVTSPMGGSITWDPVDEEYACTIEGAFADHDWTIEDPADTLAVPDPALEFIEIPSPADGDYYVLIMGTETGEFALAICDFDTDGSHSAADVVGTTSEGGLELYRVSYSSVPGSEVQVEQVEPSHLEQDVEKDRGALLQVQPNPMAQSTTFLFRVPEPCRVTLELFDPSGRVVATLHNGSRTAGVQAVTWRGDSDDGREVPAGVYFARLALGEQVELRRILLLR
jgi:hypothetical protein